MKIFFLLKFEIFYENHPPSRNLSEEKKNPPRAQIFRYFRIESQNNKTARIRAKP